MKEEKLYNNEAEAAVIGSVIIDNEKFNKVLELISDEDFYDERHKWIFRAMIFLHKDNTDIDVLTLADFLKNQGYLDLAGGASYLAEMTNYVPTSSRALTYAKIVADDSAKRKIKKAADMIGKASEDSTLSLEETLKQVQDQIHEVNKVGGKQNKYQVSSMLDYADAAEEDYKNWNKMRGLSTGFPSLDKLTLGLVGGELIIVAGPTSKGKTLLSMHIANNVAKTGKRVLFVTLEMTKAQLTSRYMYVNGGRDTSAFATVAANTVFQENRRLNWTDIDGLIQNAKEELDVDLVVIDHLHYFARNVKNANDQLGEITMTFADNAKKYDIPIILISHIRKMDKDEDLSGDALRGSSLIAQDSDIVLLVNRSPETNQMGVLIDKNRNRGKLSDRTKDWKGRSEREINTIYFDFNDMKLHDQYVPPEPIQQIFPGATVLK